MRRLLLVLLFALLLAGKCLAADASFDARSEAMGAGAVEEAVPEEARSILGNAGVSSGLDAEGLLTRVWNAAAAKAGEILTRGARSAAALVAAALLCGLLTAMTDGAGGKYVSLAGALSVALIAAGDAGTFITGGADALAALSDFSHALLPCMTAAAAAGGAAASAAAKYAATALFMDIFLTLARSAVLPLVYGYMAASVGAAAMDSPALDGAASLMKWLACALMTALVTAFTLYLSLTGAVTGAADALAVKAAKTALSAALPVVGGILSDAAGTVVAGAGLVRGAVGVFGLAVTACVCLVPFLSLGVQYLLYKAAAAVSAAFADKRLGGLIGALGGAFGMVLGLVGAGALMLFFSILSLIKAAVA